MSTARKREELEAAAWRVPGISPAQVDAILAAADKYADTARAQAAVRITGETAARAVQAEAELHRRAALR